MAQSAHIAVEEALRWRVMHVDGMAIGEEDLEIAQRIVAAGG